MTTIMPRRRTSFLLLAVLLVLVLVPILEVRSFRPSSPTRRRIQQQRRRRKRVLSQPTFTEHDVLFATSSRSSSSTTTTTTTTTRNDDNDAVLSRGDASGAALRLQDVTIFRGASPVLLQDINWRIEPRAKWALIGPNGCGKSTLLKAIMGEIPYDGTITIGTKQSVGYLQQTAVAGSTKTVFDEAASAMKDILKAREALQRAEEAVAAHDSSETASKTSLEQDLKALDRATERYEQVGGYVCEKEVSEMLRGLGFTNLNQPCDSLSGGWQMRVSFAKLLLSKPSLCLMDEPSNHLDRSARKWLAQYLQHYGDGAMILVTHDRELLDSCDHIAEITSLGTLQLYKSCTYSEYLALKEGRSRAAVAEYEKNVDKAAKLQGFVDRFGASATKASAAQSRVKQLEKMKAQGLLDAPAEDIMGKQFKPSLNLPPPPKSIGEILLELDANSVVGYRDESADTFPLIPLDSMLEIRRGMKILVRGPNGSGKSTLLETLRGTLPLLHGHRVENESLRVGYFTQDLAQELDTSRRAVDLVTSYARGGVDGDVFISDQQARSVLGGLGLTGNKALRLVGDLSGGEKARVALAMFALKPSNLYLLDEVSNHLDIECVEALSESLSGWGGEDGSIIVISHDKSFCEQVGFTHVLTIQDDGTLKLEQRNANENDWDASTTTLQRSMKNDYDTTDDSTSNNADTSILKELDRETRKKTYNAPKRIAKIETLVEAKEGKIATIDEEMLANGSDVGKLVDLSKEKDQLETEIMELMEEWEELETFLATIEES